MAELVAIYAVFKIFIGELLITFLTNRHKQFNEELEKYIKNYSYVLTGHYDNFAKFIIQVAICATVLALLFIGLIIVERAFSITPLCLYIGFFVLLAFDISFSVFLYRKFYKENSFFASN